jgi:peptidyl-prolyl cis-trans isomerase C
MRKWNEKKDLLLILMVGMILWVAATACLAKEETKEVARVGDKAITEEELQKEMVAQAYQFGVKMATLPEDRKERYRQVILHRMIDLQLILDASKENKIQVTDAEIQGEMDNIKKRFPDPKNFEAVLAQRNITLKEVEGKIREGLMVRKVMDQVTTSTPSLSDAEVEKYYKDNPDRFKRDEEARASHILIKVDKGATAEDKDKARKKIQDIREQIVKGADFAKLAEENSDCPSGKSSGGDLDWFGRGVMDPTFEKTAFALKPGEMSDIIETQFGFHIIKLTDKREAGTVSLAEVKGDLKEELVQKAREEKFSDWLKKQKDAKAVFTNPADKEFPAQEQKPAEKSE